MPTGISHFVVRFRELVAVPGLEVRHMTSQGEPETGVAVVGKERLKVLRRIHPEISAFRPDIVHVHGHWVRSSLPRQR